MTLALLVTFTAIPVWLAILVSRWALVRPVTRTISGRAAFAALGFSGATVGGMYPLLWAMLRSLNTWIATGSTTFTFTGNLPPGVDEDDLLTVLVVGMIILVGQAFAEVADSLR